MLSNSYYIFIFKVSIFFEHLNSLWGRYQLNLTKLIYVFLFFFDRLNCNRAIDCN